MKGCNNWNVHSDRWVNFPQSRVEQLCSTPGGAVPTGEGRPKQPVDQGNGVDSVVSTNGALVMGWTPKD